MASKTIKVQLRMTEELQSKYKEKAEQMGITVSSMMTIALNEYLRTEDMTKTIIEMVQSQTKNNEDNA